MQWFFRRKLGVITLLVSLLILSLTLTGCGGSDEGGGQQQSSEPVKWTANSVWPPENHQSIGLVDFVEKVKESTDGKLET